MLGARHCALVGLLLRAPALRRTGTGAPEQMGVCGDSKG